MALDIHFDWIHLALILTTVTFFVLSVVLWIKAKKTSTHEAVRQEPLEEQTALQLLTLLQREARLLDFLAEDLAGFSDAEVGAAARVVHEGGRKTLKNYFELSPVRQEEEESQVTIEEGFDPQRIRLTGKVVGKAPFKGTLVHKGWQVTQINLPELTRGHNAKIIAPAEVEL